jgi:hypothetical protein
MRYVRMEREVKQTRIDEFMVEDRNREAISRIQRNHVDKLSKIFNEVFERLFDQPYVVRCDE